MNDRSGLLPIPILTDPADTTISSMGKYRHVSVSIGIVEFTESIQTDTLDRFGSVVSGIGRSLVLKRVPTLINVAHFRYFVSFNLKN